MEVGAPVRRGDDGRPASRTSRGTPFAGPAAQVNAGQRASMSWRAVSARLEKSLRITSGAHLRHGLERVAEIDRDHGHARVLRRIDVGPRVADHHAALRHAAGPRDRLEEVAAVGLLHVERIAAEKRREALRQPELLEKQAGQPLRLVGADGRAPALGAQHLDLLEHMGEGGAVGVDVGLVVIEEILQHRLDQCRLGRDVLRLEAAPYERLGARADHVLRLLQGEGGEGSAASAPS